MGVKAKSYELIFMFHIQIFLNPILKKAKKSLKDKHKHEHKNMNKCDHIVIKICSFNKKNRCAIKKYYKCINKSRIDLLIKVLIKSIIDVLIDIDLNNQFNCK